MQTQQRTDFRILWVWHPRKHWILESGKPGRDCPALGTKQGCVQPALEATISLLPGSPRRWPGSWSNLWSTRTGKQFTVVQGSGSELHHVRHGLREQTTCPWTLVRASGILQAGCVPLPFCLDYLRGAMHYCGSTIRDTACKGPRQIKSHAARTCKP